MKVKCKHCGQSYQESYIGQHLRGAHGVRGGRTGTIRRQAGETIAAAVEVFQPVRQAPVAAEAPRIAPKATQDGFKVVDGFVLLERADGTLWLAEKIR